VHLPGTFLDYSDKIRLDRYSVTTNRYCLGCTCLGAQIARQVGWLDISVPSVLSWIYCAVELTLATKVLCKIQLICMSNTLICYTDEIYLVRFSVTVNVMGLCLGAQIAGRVDWLDISVPSVLSWILYQ